jgi:hypothetical protein
VCAPFCCVLQFRTYDQLCGRSCLFLTCLFCRRLISETSLSLLGLTMLASMLHLLFEFLAFQSDITFWKENKSLAGLSTRTLVTDLVSQIIVFLFLVDNAASLLVTVPTAFGLVVQAWKVKFRAVCLVL